MANPLTGDMQGILQVSGRTLNRLLASMHQNAYRNARTPSFPNAVRMRIGDDLAFEGVRGILEAQISVPRIELSHGATDRFTLHVWIRGWYRGDPGTERLAQYLHGEVTAEYRLRPIDANVPAWSRHADDYLWFRVVRDSVKFRGSANDDIGLLDIFAMPGADLDAAAQAMNAKVERQVARLLAKRFEATPHPVSSHFRRGALRCLKVAGEGTAIVAALPLDKASAGDIASVDRILLDGRDLAVAISRDYVMSILQEMLEPFANFNRSVPVHVDTGPFLPDIDTVYRVRMSVPSATWSPQGDHALLAVRINGTATTDSVLPNVSFEIDQTLVLGFAGNGFILSPGTWSSRVNVSGAFSGIVANKVSQAIAEALPGMVRSACDQANPRLAAIAGRTDDLANQLRSLDARAAIALDVADFQDEGIVARGTIYLSPRHAIVLRQRKAPAGDAHTALESWIPGGRIDRLEWDWIWGGPFGETGSAKLTDRFLLQRSYVATGRWGLGMGAKTPIPGLDGSGLVGLRIIGKVVDEVTGDWVDVTSKRVSTTFGLSFSRRIDPHLITPPWLRLPTYPEKGMPTPPWRERALVAVGRNPQVAAAATNTLVVFAPRDWDAASTGILTQGIDACRRFDAGLNVLILFPEGLLDERQIDTAAIERGLGTVGLLCHVNEDVDGSWSGALGLAERGADVAWAIVTPEGAQAWRHIGAVKPQELGAALDLHLRRTPDAGVVGYEAPLEAGRVLDTHALRFPLADDDSADEPRSPPLTLSRGATGDTILVFIHPRASMSIRNLRSVAARRKSEADRVVAIVEGVGAKEIETWRRDQGIDFVAVPDPEGRLGRRFGVDTWPTTITVSAGGMVSDVAVGIEAPAVTPDQTRTSE